MLARAFAGMVRRAGVWGGPFVGHFENAVCVQLINQRRIWKYSMTARHTAYNTFAANDSFVRSNKTTVMSGGGGSPAPAYYAALS